MFKRALKGVPFFANIAKISEVETSYDLFRLVIIKNTSSMKISTFPLSSVIGFPWRIVERAYTFHLIFDPIALVSHTIGIHKDSFSVFFTSHNLSLITISILFDNLKLTLIRFYFWGLLRVRIAILFVLFFNYCGWNIRFYYASAGSTVTIFINF